jgi:anthraniloyl-CoA monooxygenase
VTFVGALEGGLDPHHETHDRIVAAGRSWRDMEVRVGGRELRYGGYGFTAVARRVLLGILQEQAAAGGCGSTFATVADSARLCSGHRFGVAPEGVGSETRDARGEISGTGIGEVRQDSSGTGRWHRRSESPSRS